MHIWTSKLDGVSSWHLLLKSMSAWVENLWGYLSVANEVTRLASCPFHCSPSCAPWFLLGLSIGFGACVLGFCLVVCLWAFHFGLSIPIFTPGQRVVSRSRLGRYLEWVVRWQSARFVTWLQSWNSWKSGNLKVKALPVPPRTKVILEGTQRLELLLLGPLCLKSFFRPSHRSLEIGSWVRKQAYHTLGLLFGRLKTDLAVFLLSLRTKHHSCVRIWERASSGFTSVFLQVFGVVLRLRPSLSSCLLLSCQALQSTPSFCAHLDLVDLSGLIPRLTLRPFVLNLQVRTGLHTALPLSLSWRSFAKEPRSRCRHFSSHVESGPFKVCKPGRPISPCANCS